MNTFEKHFSRFPSFIRGIQSWQPDYIVPVAKKGCKLLKATQRTFGIDLSPSQVKYKEYFQLNQVPVRGKKVAIIDDATQFTSTLLEYRRYFENLEADVRTFSFAGHESLFKGHRWKYDERAEIGVFLPDAVYQEYILQQSYFLLHSGTHFDLDHIVLELKLNTEEVGRLRRLLRKYGFLLSFDDYFLNNGTSRFSVDRVTFFSGVPYLSDPSITTGPIRKIKFVFDSNSNTLLFSPLVFPSWKYAAFNGEGDLFASVPFWLPFRSPHAFDKRSKKARQQAYFNIAATYATSLAKAFTQVLDAEQFPISEISIRRNDLDAVLEYDDAETFSSGLCAFLTAKSKHDFGIDRSYPLQGSGKYNSLADLLDDLKKVYEKKVARERSRIGVHHLASYDSLFEKFTDPLTLSAGIDYYCDLGVLVPQTVDRNGEYLRACRTGEPNSEYNWQRTQVLIPIAIEQVRKELGLTEPALAPMLLNKILSNFVYDYPSEHYHELHCLIGAPHDFGTLVRVYHHHRATSRPSIYNARRISPYYSWNGTKKRFIGTANMPEVTKKIRYLFDERQEIPFTELITYFRLLARIYKHFDRVDVLNSLSICRDENQFYTHIVHNIRSWLEEFGIYLECSEDPDRRVDAEKALHHSGTHCDSAAEKLRLALGIRDVMRDVETEFANDLEFVKAVEKIKSNFHAFSERFLKLLTKLHAIVSIQSALTNLALYAIDPRTKYKTKLCTLQWDALTIPALKGVPSSGVNLLLHAAHHGAKLAEMTVALQQEIGALPREQPLLAYRLVQEGTRRAKNILTHLVYRDDLSELSLLFIDLSGLRRLPEPKDVVMGKYYSSVQTHATSRDGIRLYGGSNGDDAFTYLFASPLAAIECAKDIKDAVASDLFFKAQALDIKFGLSFVSLPPDQREEVAIKAWGLAKDYCEFKSVEFRNKGNFLAHGNTVRAIQTKWPSVAEQFAPLGVEMPSVNNDDRPYYHVGIVPFGG